MSPALQMLLACVVFVIASCSSYLGYEHSKNNGKTAVNGIVCVGGLFLAGASVISMLSLIAS